ncbi:MAG: hypothetical protein U5K38_19160 [Woeseiaceae bacterium]|nr:hypothetical protein [Woeseiaceae bacterium]
MQAICVDDVSGAIASIGEIQERHATLLEQVTATNVTSPITGARLAAKVSNAPAAISDLLNVVHTAATLNEALAMRESLASGESVITADGVWLSKHWLRVCRDKDAKAGVIRREHEMRRLKDEIRELKARTDNARNLLTDGRTRLNQLEERRETSQQDASSLLAEYSEVKANLDAARYRMDQATARAATLAEESRELETEQRDASEQIAASRSRFARASETLEELKSQRDNLEGHREELRAEVARVRQQAEQDRNTAQDLAIRFESRRSSKESAAQSLERMQRQLEHFGRREHEIREQLANGEEPRSEKRQQLAEHLDIRVRVENELAEARKLVEDVESQLRELDQSRLQVDQTVDDARTQVSEAKLSVQEVRVRREGVNDQFTHTGFDLATVLEGLADDADPATWEENLDKLRRRIERLGPINLAAIDEFKEQSERKEYLDSQLKDLQDALSTLEGAIRKIDRETRTRFRETFTQVDNGFKRLFPKLFGGGHAYLELTGDDLLAAGVTVMARPPGKRNSTIHLLSGGEKR